MSVKKFVFTSVKSLIDCKICCDCDQVSLTTYSQQVPDKRGDLGLISR